MKAIPFLSATRINTIEYYQRFRNCKAYIKEKSKVNPTTQELILASGYSPKKVSKFSDHRKEFDNLKQKIPKTYLNTIGVDKNTLFYLSELDREEFEQMKRSKELYPEYAIVRVMPAVYKNIRFHTDTHEEEAIRLLISYSAANKLRTCINYPELKSVYVEPDGSFNTIYYPPTLTETRCFIVPGINGENLGKTYVG
ncbi:MAG: hypothetical protein ACOWWR_16175 [Eubacteriales bacterium]